MQTKIMTHRGLDTDEKNFYSESSFEAFQHLLSRGYGAECDPCFLKDQIIIAHDISLARVTNGKSTSNLTTMTADQVKEIPLPHGRICFLHELLELARTHNSTLALHLKPHFHQRHYIERLLQALNSFKDLHAQLLIIGVPPQTVDIFTSLSNTFALSPIVVHPYDLERYNSTVEDTMISLEEAIQQHSLYDWVWLEEWDTIGPNGTEKRFYTADTFERLRKAGFRIGAITPEIHATSPGHDSEEFHTLASSDKTLFKSIEEMIALKPDLICTDRPETVRSLSHL